MNKRIGPTLVVILVTFFVILQAAGLIYALRTEGIGLFWKLLIVLIPLLFIIALVWVYIERMKEIREEEKEDLDRY
jgi:hypothetical protein